nr:hypothetical protein Hi04_10k_c2441A_00024 [uncultured bacterium]UXE44483.1 hypothetical protein Hi04_10k_c2441B_00031 [uncultured bacterium]
MRGSWRAVMVKDRLLTPSGNALVGAALVGVTTLAVHLAFKLDCDDAYIYLRIARNWASGLGPVFNAGEHVEAFASPTWLALLAIGIRVGITPTTLAPALAILAAAFAGAGTAVLARHLAGPRAGLVAPIVLAMQIPFAVWSAVPREHGLTAGAIAWAAFAALRTKRGSHGALAGLAAAFAALVRPEALLLVPFLGLVALLDVRRPDRARVALAFAAGALVPLAVVFLWRYSYFGSLLPNTYVSRVQGLPLGQRVRTGMVYLARLAVFEGVLVACNAWALWKGSTGARAVALLAFVFLGGVILTTGGDWFVYARMAIPAVPLLCVVAAVAIERAHGIAFHVLVAALVLQVGVCARSKHSSGVVLLREFVDNTRVVGESFARLPPGLLAMEPIGIVGYVQPDRRILDLAGLADAHIARSPRLPGALPGFDHGDVEYVLSLAPAVVVPFSWPRDHVITDDEERAYLTENHESWAIGEQLVLDARFRRMYEPYDFVLDSGRHLRIWRRRDFVIVSSPTTRSGTAYASLPSARGAASSGGGTFR